MYERTIEILRESSGPELNANCAALCGTDEHPYHRDPYFSHYLRQQLRKRGYTLKMHADGDEVAVVAYEEFSTDTETVKVSADDELIAWARLGAIVWCREQMGAEDSDDR